MNVCSSAAKAISAAFSSQISSPEVDVVTYVSLFCMKSNISFMSRYRQFLASRRLKNTLGAVIEVGALGSTCRTLVSNKDLTWIFSLVKIGKRSSWKTDDFVLRWSDCQSDRILEPLKRWRVVDSELPWKLSSVMKSTQHIKMMSIDGNFSVQIYLLRW